MSPGMNGGPAAGRPELNVLGISGSLRAASYNTRLLRLLPTLAPGGMRFRIFDGLGDLPLFNEDLEAAHPPPPAVSRLGEAIRAADGIVISGPEYNHSISGVLKNAIDWVSRPHGSGALTAKPIAVLVATTGPKAGYRGLAETVRILTDLGNVIVPEPQVVIQSARTAITAGHGGVDFLADPIAAELIGIQLEALAELIHADAASAGLRAARRHRKAILRALDIPDEPQVPEPAAGPAPEKRVRSG